MDITIVAYNSPEYAQIKQLRQDVLRTPLGLILSEKDLAGEENQTHICAIENDTVIASVIFKPLEKNLIKLRQMAVADNHQGRGVGNKIVRFGEDWAKQQGFKIIELHARISALNFYKKLGYHSIGETFTEVGVPTIKMIKDL